MKKALLLSSALLLLAGCNDNQQTTDDTQAPQVETIASEDYGMEEYELTESDDNILETNDYTIELVSVEVIQSPMENGPGVFLTYNLTNNSDEPIIPNDIVDNALIIEQTTDTSIVNLQGRYYYTDAFGEDRYNEMVEKGNSMGDALLPDKTIEFYQGIYLEDENLPIVITALDYMEFYPVEYYEFEL